MRGKTPQRMGLLPGAVEKDAQNPAAVVAKLGNPDASLVGTL
jgi:hypothetical protein